LEKILITGGTGFFGKSFLRYFQENNFYDSFSVFLISRNVKKFKESCPKSIDLTNINFFQADIMKKESLPIIKFDYIIHGATDSTYGLNLQEIERSDQIVRGTRNILEWCKNIKIKRFLFISSGGVYGKITMPVDELYNTKLKTTEKHDTYSISKLFSEHLCMLYSNKYNFSYSVARCFSFSGVDLPLKSHFALGNFINNALSNKNILINGDGSPIRSYMDQRDLSHWIFKILFYGKNNNVYNVGSDKSISILDLAKLVAKESKKILI